MNGKVLFNTVPFFLSPNHNISEVNFVIEV